MDNSATSQKYKRGSANAASANIGSFVIGNSGSAQNPSNNNNNNGSSGNMIS